MARARNLAAYEGPDASAFAAAYAFGIARNHPFADGNKRMAWILCLLFLRLNDQNLAFDEAEAIKVMLDLASGNIDEAELAAWLREWVTAS